MIKQKRQITATVKFPRFENRVIFPLIGTFAVINSFELKSDFAKTLPEGAISMEQPCITDFTTDFLQEIACANAIITN